MRVHVIIDSLTWGGAEMVLGDLAASAPAAGIELTVAYLSSRDNAIAGRRLRRHGIEPERIQVRGLLDPRSFRAVRDHLSERGPDLVHTHLEYADMLGALAARSLGIPVVSTLHVMRWESAGRAGTRARLAALIRRHCAFRVVAVSDAAARAYLARGWDSADHVVTIPNGSAASPAPGAGRRVRQELGIPADALVAGMLTVLRPGKGHEVAAAAVGALRPEIPTLCLLVAGDGPSREEVERFLVPLGNAARMVGHREDVMAFLDACDVLVHPTEFDAFPTGLIEAGAAGVPVVATRVGGIPEIVADGETGILLDPPPAPGELSSALRTLLLDPHLRSAMAAAARARHTQRFGAEAWAKRLAVLYAEALSGDAAGLSRFAGLRKVRSLAAASSRPRRPG